MAINFTDSPADGATQVIGGRTYTYNSAKNKWDTTATEVAGPTATVYATVDNLPGTATTGDQAFVSGTNRLYIWNGSGWYNIALVNNTPTWTNQPSSSYTLATDGTATTITIVATDPEGLPITYSIASDTSGNIATVTQGTGLSANTFTITPSTSNSDAGTFSLTFRATDGINVASAISSFTLQFSIENSNYTTALITSVGANAAGNSTFTDASTNAVSFSVSNVYQTSFSPYRSGGYSTYFDGSSSLSVTNTGSTLAFGTGDVTVEGWLNQSLAVGTQYAILADLNVSGNGPVAFWYNGTVGTGAEFRLGAANVTQMIGFRADTPINEWFHFAYVRESGTWKFYLNGTEITTRNTDVGDADGYSFASFNPNVGSFSNGLNMSGYMRDLRVVVGTAVYTSAFTPSTERLTAITNTSLLTCHLPYIADGSTNGHTITPNGNVSVKGFTPYDSIEEYSPGTHGGSLCGNANGELTGTLPSALGSGDFTIEGWFYSENFGSNTGIVTIGNHGANGIAILLENTGKFRIDVSTSYSNNSTSNVQLNTWNHFKVIRSSGTITAYLNGVQEQSFSNTLNITATNITIGGRGGLSGYQHEGNLADIKVTASASSDTTVPTSVVSSTNALFHLPFIEAGIVDKSQTAFNAILAGNTQSSTAQTKYLSSSMYFDGSGDFIEISHDPVFNLTKDFTIECWAYFNTLSSNRVLIEKYDNSNSASWELYWRATGTSIAFYADAAPLLQDPSTSTITTGQWYHIAVSRTGSAVKLFIDGTEVDSATSSTAFTATVPIEIGRQRVNNTAQFDGYMSDVRITNGLGRYTANFTPPAAALKG